MTKIANIAVASIAVTCAAAHAAEPACDRACLVGVADVYLAAIAAHDPIKAPLR